MNVDVSEKVIVITGASRGIGKEIALAFAKENASVVINYFQSEDAARKLLDEIREYNSKCIKVKADVSKMHEVIRLYDVTYRKFGKVDVLINNAGICEDNFISLMTENEWKKVIDINLTGAFLCSREFSRLMMVQEKGKIINIASVKGQEGCEGQVNYSASKAGLIGFTKALAKEVGKYNISVNAVCPGFIETDLNRSNKMKKEIAQRKSLLSCNYAMEDLVNFIVYISSEKLRGVSGRVFNLDSRLK